MILPERVFGRPGANWITSRRGDRADFLAHPADQFLAQMFVRLGVVHQRHIGVDALALDVVRIAPRGRLANVGVGEEGALDLRRADAMAGHVDYVVDAAGDQVIAVLVSRRAPSPVKYLPG